MPLHGRPGHRRDVVEDEVEEEVEGVDTVDDVCAKTLPLLTIEPVNSKDMPLDYGNAQVGTHVARSLVLRNDGAKVLTIFLMDWLEDSHADFKSDTDGLTIPTPEDKTITIQPGANFPLTIGAYIAGGGVRKAAIRITSDSCVKNVQYIYLSTSISGTTTIDVAPPSIDYGAIEVGKTEVRSFFIKNVVPAACDPTLDPPPTKPCNKAIGVSNFKLEGADSLQFSIVSAVPVLSTDAPALHHPRLLLRSQGGLPPQRPQQRDQYGL